MIQVSRVSDVVSVGQRISLVCIGQDVRGNIKLSLKATMPRPKAEAQNGNSVPSLDSVSRVGEVSKTLHETPNSTSNTSPVDISVGSEVNSTSSVPSILIRSAEDCDEEEKKSADMNVKLKDTRKSNANSRSERKLKPLAQNGGPSNNEVDVKSPITARNLKLGVRVRAKVYQIRARGLVLDLGEGLRGMYKFEVHNRRLLLEALYFGLLLCSSVEKFHCPILLFSLLCSGRQQEQFRSWGGVTRSVFELFDQGNSCNVVGR